jgi:hypothetical protein
MTTLRSGTRLLGATSTTEMIVITAPEHDVEVTIGGVPASIDEDERSLDGPLVDGHDGGAQLGKRYTDRSQTIELLCTKAGAGAPAVDGELLAIKEAKPLPASD